MRIALAIDGDRLRERSFLTAAHVLAYRHSVEARLRSIFGGEVVTALRESGVIDQTRVLVEFDRNESAQVAAIVQRAAAQVADEVLDELADEIAGAKSSPVRRELLWAAERWARQKEIAAPDTADVANALQLIATLRSAMRQTEWAPAAEALLSLVPRDAWLIPLPGESLAFVRVALLTGILAIGTSPASG